MIVLDTNVVSELMRPSPSTRVLTWVREHEESDLYTSAITLAEIRYGIERLADGRRKQALSAVADDVFGRFAERVLRSMPGLRSDTPRSCPVASTMAARSTASTRRSRRSANSTAPRSRPATSPTLNTPASS